MGATRQIDVRLRPLAMALMGALLGGLVPAPARAEPQALAIVVDRDNPRSDIGVEELRSLFLGKRGEWPDGTRAVTVDLESNSARRAFCAAVLKMTEAEYERYWVDQRVRGAGTGPRSLSDARLVVRLVARVRGAVGYVPVSQVDGSVKVLSVGGVRPGEAGYPIIGGAAWDIPSPEEFIASSAGVPGRPRSRSLPNGTLRRGRRGDAVSASSAPLGDADAG